LIIGLHSASVPEESGNLAASPAQAIAPDGAGLQDDSARTADFSAQRLLDGPTTGRRIHRIDHRPDGFR
jgi:hypothetical protein